MYITDIFESLLQHYHNGADEAALESLLFDTVYRQSGILTQSHLASPRIFALSKFELPRNSIYHYISNKPDEVAPGLNNALLVNNKRLIHMYHVTQLTHVGENVIRIKQSIAGQLDSFHTKNRRFKKTLAFQTGLRDPQAPLVVNYTGLMGRLYTYQVKPKEIYQKGLDLYTTVVDTLHKFQSEVSDPKGTYQHFLFFEVPQQIPTLARVKEFAKGGVSNELHNTFGNLDAIMLFDLYRFASNDNDRQNSLIAKLPNPNTINIIITHKDNSVMINLGKLLALRRSITNKSGIDPDTLKLLVLKIYLILLKHSKEKIVEDSVLVDKDDNNEEGNENAEQSTDNGQAQSEVTSDSDDDDEEGESENQPPDENTEIVKLIEQSQQAVTKEEPVTDTDADDGNQQQDTLKTDIDEKMEKILSKSIEDEMELLGKAAKDNAIKVHEAQKGTSLYDENIPFNSNDFSQGYKNILEGLVENGTIQPKAINRYEKLSGRIKELPPPIIRDNDGILVSDAESLEDFAKTPDDLINIEDALNAPIANIDSVTDKSMLKSSLNTFDKHYINKVLPRDMAAVAVSLQNAGVAVTDFQFFEESSVEGINQIYQMRVHPLNGQPSTIKIRIPKLDNSGSFISNNIKYRMRKQRFPLPIQKVSPTRVALSSYYGKVFVEKSSKKVNNYFKWLGTTIRAQALSKENGFIQDSKTGNVYYNDITTPVMYSALSMEFRIIETVDYRFYFDYKRRFKFFGEDIGLQEVEKKTGYTLIGQAKSKKNTFVFMDKDNVLYEYDLTNKTQTKVAEIIEYLGINPKGAPLETVNLLLAGKEVPIGIILAYDLGIDELLRRLNVRYREVNNITDGARVRIKLEPYEYAIRFMDKTLIFDRRDRFATMIMSGFWTYYDSVSEYNYELFNTKEIYYNILEANKLSSRYIREIDLQYQMFIDPITYRILEQMGMPTNYRGLLFKSVEMMLDNNHPDEIDGAHLRIRSYERFPGIAYNEIVKALRVHKSRGIGTNYGIEVNPNAVYFAIVKDPSMDTVHNVNPIQDLKEIEAVTYSGVGGRSADTMVKRTRAFHENDMGTISEAGTDNGKVGINTYTSASPKFTNVYGVSRQVDKKANDFAPSEMLSSTSLTGSCLLHDDSKRIGFASIMNAHIVPIDGAGITPLRTGYEQVIAHRVKEPFVSKAPIDGKVISVSDDEILIEGKDGETKSLIIGRSYGSTGGLHVPQDLAADVKIGDKVSKGDIVAYNPRFFMKDLFGNVAMKNGVMGRIALMEKNETLEDSSMVTKSFANKLAMSITKKVPVRVQFDNVIHRIKKIGDKVEAEDILCIIEEAMTASNSMFDEESIMTLQALGAMTPKAKKDGIVEKIEVFYNGDKEDMSDSLRAIADASDRRMIKETKATTGGKGYGGSVTDNFKYEAKPIEPDTALIVFYITGPEGFGSGDKCLFANQMKSTACSVLDDGIETESGVAIDGIFGIRSIYARIVLSPMLMGTTNALLVTLGKKVAEKYLPK